MSHSSAEEGQGLVEYALILVLVVFVVVISLQIVGPAVGNMLLVTCMVRLLRPCLDWDSLNSDPLRCLRLFGS
jgi:pilus assembly protein Flp/PilA